MTEITISVGLNDAVTKLHEHPTKVYVDIITESMVRAYYIKEELPK